MAKRILICEKSSYNSKLNDGILAFMILILGDFRVSCLIKKEEIIGFIINVLENLEESEYPILAFEAEKEIEKLFPSYNFFELRKKIISYLILEQNRGMIGLRYEDSISSISNEKVLKYFDEQLYVKVLDCVYDLLIEMSKKLSFDTFSKKIRIGRKTCSILYPDYEFEDSLKLLTIDILMWINYNKLGAFCSLEKAEDCLYLKVTV